MPTKKRQIKPAIDDWNTVLRSSGNLPHLSLRRSPRPVPIATQVVANAPQVVANRVGVVANGGEVVAKAHRVVTKFAVKTNNPNVFNAGV